jgi:bacterioferritin-associated ferredoxin
MRPDDEVCLCFHVTKRKVVQFIKRGSAQVPSQVSECLGAGTGCGWCRPFLKRLFEQTADPSARRPAEESGGPGSLAEAPGDEAATEEPSAEQYAAMRQQYLARREGAPE